MEIDDWNYECTAGYQGYQYDSLSGLTTYYLVTAGHCFHPGEIIEHSVYVVGTVQDTHYFNGSGNDSQLISMDALSASPNFFINSTAQRTFTGVDHTPQVGGQVCKFGITSGYTCANISAMHQTVTYVDGVTLTNQIIADNPGTSVALPGDSGSAMWNYTQDGGYHIDGILSGGSEGDSPQGQEVIFSDVDIINQNEGITAYTG